MYISMEVDFYGRNRVLSTYLRTRRDITPDVKTSRNVTTSDVQIDVVPPPESWNASLRECEVVSSGFTHNS